MAIRYGRHGCGCSRPTDRALALTLLLGCSLFVGLAHSGAAAGAERHCSATALLQHTACRNEVRDDHFTARAICRNESDEDERRDCLADAEATLREDYRLCRAQRGARLELCDALGEDRYDPDFSPALFEHDFTLLGVPNPYFPLGIGSRWKYQGGDEVIVVQVRNRTKLIEGVTCIVVNDRVEEEGVVIENTDDWFGHRKNGTVDYCGEISRNFEIFEGDVPELPELVDVEGSWKAGRDGDRSGTQFLRWPTVGTIYRQEWSPGNAEDVARVVSISYRYGDEPELDRFVPRALAGLLCAAGDCVVTAELTPIEPGELEYKYYAAGIGLFLEVDPKSGDIVQLVECNVDPRCTILPAP